MHMLIHAQIERCDSGVGVTSHTGERVSSDFVRFGRSRPDSRGRCVGAPVASTHTHIQYTTVGGIYGCGKVSIQGLYTLDDRGVFHLVHCCLRYGSRAQKPAMWEVPLCRGFGTMHAALGDECGPRIETWGVVLTWGRLGARASGGPGKVQDARYLPKSVPSRCECNVHMPDPCTVDSRFAGFDRSRRLQTCITSRNSPRLACVAQASPISRRVALAKV